MSIQQLNLYDDSLRPPRIWLTPLRLALALALLIGALALAAAWLRRDAAHWQEVAAQQQAELDRLVVLAPMAADTELPALRDQLARAQAMLQALEQGGPREQPAEVLAALAAAAPGDVWLTRASWQAAPRGLALEGGLLDPRRLPDYLRRLEAQPAFQGQGFAQLQLEPVAAEQQPEQHRFVLRSQSREARR